MWTDERLDVLTVRAYLGTGERSGKLTGSQTWTDERFNVLTVRAYIGTGERADGLASGR